MKKKTKTTNFWISLNNFKIRDFFAEETLFPRLDIFKHQWSFQNQAIIFLVLCFLFTVVGWFIPANGFIAFDWVYVFSVKRLPPFYPPWGQWILSLLTWPLLFGLSMAGIALAILKRAVNPISGIAALLSLPVFWTMFLGQLEGLIVLGLIGLPWLTPIALLKPQVSIFAFGARKSYMIAAIFWILLSVLIWGPWPLKMFAVNSYYAEGRYVQDIAIGWIGFFIAFPLFWFSRGDMDMLMISGAFMTPHLIPYNMLPFIPAIARLNPVVALVACFLSWLPLSANWLGKSGWWLGWLFVIWLWVWLAVKRYTQKK